MTRCTRNSDGEVAINQSPQFKTGAGWGAGYKNALDPNGGVIVGPGSNNVFAQGFEVTPQSTYKVFACAQSLDANSSLAAIQINWVDAEHKYISHTKVTFEATSEPVLYSHSTLAPANAANGILYVVPGGAENKIRYTEMTLLTPSPIEKAVDYVTSHSIFVFVVSALILVAAFVAFRRGRRQASDGLQK